MAPLMASYLAGTDEATGEVFANRRKLETSIQLINKPSMDTWKTP